MSKAFLMNCPMVMQCNEAGHCCQAASPLVGERDKLRHLDLFFIAQYDKEKLKNLVVGSALCLEDKMCISFALLLSLLFS